MCEPLRRIDGKVSLGESAMMLLLFALYEVEACDVMAAAVHPTIRLRA